MPTYPLPTLAPTIDSTGINAPSYNDILQSLTASFQAIYGSDIYVAPDSQDGQWLAVLANAIHNSNQSAISLFTSFAPTYAQGAELSSLVKINGLARQASSSSTAVGNVIGVVGTIINNGVVADANGNYWDLPASVTIPAGGTVAVTVTAQDSGNLTAGVGTINQIHTPQLGWQSFSNTSAAVPGAPVESDAALRTRQTISTAIPALAIKEAIFAAIGNTAGVTRFTVYENDTATPDVNGIPGHSLSAVVEGGSVADIAAAIAGRKPPGIQTYGSTSQIVYDTFGLPVTINYYPLTLVPIYFDITIAALSGYVATTGSLIISTLVAFVNSLSIGEDVYEAQAQASASLITLGLGKTFKITAFALDITPAPVATADLTIAFNAAASCQAADVTLTVV